MTMRHLSSNNSYMANRTGIWRAGTGLIYTIALTAGLLISPPSSSHAESWVSFFSIKLELPGGNTVVKGYSESYYDSDSIQRLGGSRVQVWLKDVTYIGDLEPHIHKELLKVNCPENSFESLVEVERPGLSAKLEEINRGTIGEDSPYHSIRKIICGY